MAQRPRPTRSPTPGKRARGGSALIEAAACEAFLVHEARLLDEGRYDAWLALFAADAWYWVPIEPNQKSPLDTVSLIYDDRRLLETRVRRLASPRIHSQEPPSRTSRIVANVTIEEAGAEACTVRSKLLVLEYRREQQRMLGGTCFHRLARAGSALQIAWKRVNLVNCDAVMDGLVVPL